MAEQGTVAYVATLPMCDFCRMNNADVEVPAHFDAATRRPDGLPGPWAMMCSTHFGLYGIGLGVGRGQRLVVDVPQKVELSEGNEVMIKVVTPPCPYCGETTIVELTREEFSKVSHPSRPNIADSLPERDLAFRELFITGTHSACWDLFVRGPEDES